MRDSRLERSLRRYSPRRYSPVRKTLAQELRDDRIERSIRRSLRRSTYVSPLRETYVSPLREAEKERAISAARLRNDVRLSVLDESRRYWSPSRNAWAYRTSYYSPARVRLDAIERDEIRRSLSRSRLRDSLMLEKKGSAYKSTAAKTYKSWYDSTRDQRELSPVNQSKMIVNFKDSIFDNKVLEEKRTNLAMRYDFCLTDIFAMVDFNRSGVITIEDLRRFSYDNSLALDSGDLRVIIDRFDKDRDGRLSFSEFSDLWLPKSNENRRMMQERLGRSVNNFNEFTTVTQSHIRDLLRSVVTVEEKFESNKFRLTDGRYLSADEIFAFLDKWKTGSVSLTEFQQSLEDAGIFCTAEDAKTLFEQFDKNKDGRITFDEFTSPVRSRYY